MSVEQKIIVNGHVDPQILRDFALHPDEFDDDAVEHIWQHLDQCEDCVAKYETGRDDRLTEVPHKRDVTPDPDILTAGSDGAREADAIDPDDIAEAKIQKPEAAEPKPASDETPPEKPVEELEDEGDTEDKTEGETRRPKIKLIEGLITNERKKLDEDVARLETESDFDASDRIAKESAAATSDVEADQPADSKDGDETAGTDEVAESESADSEVGTSPPGESAEGERAKIPEWKEEGVKIPDSTDRGTSAERENVEDAVEDGQDPFITPGKETPSSPSPPRDKATAPRAARPSPPTKPRSAAKVPETAKKPAQKKSEPLEDVLNRALAFLARPRNAIICGAVALCIAAGIVAAVLFSGGTTASPVAGWEPLNVIETRVPLQEVPTRKMRNGRLPRADGTDLTLYFRGIDKLVIAVDLDFIKGKTTPYEVIVRDPSGMSVFQEQIPQLYLDDGRFFLRLVPKLFQSEQTYKMELVSVRNDGSQLVVAETVFDVAK